jgi:hypothetical protein
MLLEELAYFAGAASAGLSAAGLVVVLLWLVLFLVVVVPPLVLVEVEDFVVLSDAAAGFAASWANAANDVTRTRALRRFFIVSSAPGCAGLTRPVETLQSMRCATKKQGAYRLPGRRLGLQATGCRRITSRPGPGHPSPPGPSRPSPGLPSQASRPSCRTSPELPWRLQELPQGPRPEPGRKPQMTSRGRALR